MRRLFRRRAALSALALLPFLAALALWAYTRSDAAARRVGEKIEARLGTRAQVDRLDVGLTETGVCGLRVFEPDGGPDGDPVLSAERVDLNVSGLGAVLGRQASAMRVRGAHLLLRYDRAGKLLTRLPAGGGSDPLPTIEVEGGSLTLRQEGRADATFVGLRATLAPADGGLALAGTADDPAWGKWAADGLVPAGGGPTRLTLRTREPQAVTPEQVRELPLVSPTAWKHVTVAGTTAARLDVTFDPATGEVRCPVHLDPTATTVDVPAIDLHVTDAAGRFDSAGRVVTLTDVRGRTAGGTVRVHARMDFSGPDYTLRYTADLAGLDVHQLPKRWRFPANIDGRLTGRMDFAVTVGADGQVKVDAFGRTRVNEARLNGEPVAPIDLDVRQGESGGLEFARRPAPARHQALKPDDGPAAPRPAAGRTGLVSAALRLAARLVKPLGAAKEDREYLHLNLTFRDVDLAELLKTMKVDAPVGVGGRVTARIQLSVPTEAPDELKAYRLAGTLTARRVTFDDLALEDAAATLDMRDGRLTVKELTGKLPAAGGKPGGTLRVQGELGVGGDYPFRATVKAEALPLEAAARLKSLFPESLQLAGEASGQATLKGTLRPLAVRSSGAAQVVGLRAGPLPVDRLSFRWTSDGDGLRVREAAASLFGGKVVGTLDYPFRSDEAGTGAFKVDGLDLGEVSRGLPAGVNLKMEGKASGSVTVRAPAAGEGGPRGATAEIDLQAPALKFQGIPARQIKGTATYAAGVAQYALTGEALGGQFEVSGRYPPPKKPAAARPPAKPEADPDAGRIKFRRVRLSGIWEALGVTGALGVLDAELSGTLPLDTNDAGRLVGSGRVQADRVRWNGTDMPGAGQATVSLTATGLTVEDATLQAGTGVARFRVAYDWADPDRGEATVSLTNVPAARVLYLLPDLGKHLDMNVDGRLTTRMGREWRGSGVLTATKGKVYGIPVADVRVPIDWAVTPGRGRAQVRVREATATAAGGQLAARAEVNLFNDLPPRVDGEVQFKGANLSQAFREAGKVAGNLVVTGTLAFGADQYRTPADLSARLDARLGESQPFSLPVFSALVPYLGSVRDSSATVQEGEVRASLGKGVWRVQKLTLTGPSVDLYADGSVAAGGGLNLSVTATSRQRPAQAVVRRALPATVLTPTSVQPLGATGLATALGFLGNYVVHLEVTGTVDSPTVRLQTLRTLTDDAVRFFVLRYLAPVQ